MFYATFIFGYPGDTPDSFEHVYRFVMKHKLAISNFNPLLVMPGTNLYDKLNKQGKLIDPQWWLSGDYNYGDATHYPDNMTPQQLAEGCRKLRYKFYSIPGILLRVFKTTNLRHLFVFSVINIISFIEIRRKQKSKLGGDGSR